uniref:Uncharacterized protein n=1 Tax=Glossina brevipalpis TaxID=37001 RepID=A0A1A9WWI9_9MUSC
MCTTLEKLEVLDRETGIMLDELAYEVRQLFPEETIPVSLMSTVYLSAKLNYPLQLAAAMNVSSKRRIIKASTSPCGSEVDSVGDSVLKLAAFDDTDTESRLMPEEGRISAVGSKRGSLYSFKSVVDSASATSFVSLTSKC